MIRILKSLNINKSYEGKTILRDISFCFKEDSIYSLVGESGSGKSTFSKILVGLESPDKGSIFFDDIEIIINSNGEKKWRKNINMVFQDAFSSLNPKWKIFKSIEEPMINFLDISRKERKKQIEDLIVEVGLNTHYLQKYPHQISGGQQKRIAIARAISCNPKFIVFDEAISGLDKETKYKILDLLLKLRKKISSTYIFITHDEDVAKYVGGQKLTLSEGKIREDYYEEKSIVI